MALSIPILGSQSTNLTLFRYSCSRGPTRRQYPVLTDIETQIRATLEETAITSEYATRVRICFNQWQLTTWIPLAKLPQSDNPTKTTLETSL